MNEDDTAKAQVIGRAQWESRGATTVEALEHALGEITRHAAAQLPDLMTTRPGTRLRMEATSIANRGLSFAISLTITPLRRTDA